MRHLLWIGGIVIGVGLLYPLNADEPAPTENAGAKPPKLIAVEEEGKEEAEPKARDVEPPGKTAAGKTGVVIPDPHTLYRRSLTNAAMRGARWLVNSQRADGLFVYGWNPSLNKPVAEDHYLRQAGTAAALARAAAYTRDNQITLTARQALLVLLANCTADDADNDIRKPTVSPAEANPVGLAGLLLLAIAELPEPSDALLDQGERLARFLKSKQQEDGSFDLGTGADAETGIDYYPGEALYGLVRSYSRRPEKWKLEVLAKAFDIYHRRFKEKPSMAFVPWQTGAYAEAFFITNESRYRDFVFEMNDWLINYQYVGQNAALETWEGGFGGYEAGHAVRIPPGATTGSFAEGLVDAYRVAELTKDTRRLADYTLSLRLAFRFLFSLQYSPQSHPHFEPWFAKKINGAFFASVDDGLIRIDFTQHAISAMFHYATHVTQAPKFENPAAN